MPSLTRRLLPAALVTLALSASACSLISNFDGLTGGHEDVGAGDAGSDRTLLDAGAGDAGGDRCAEGKGPRGVPVGSFCVDSTEVTNAHYAEFVAAKNEDMRGQPPVCAFNTTYRPAASWPSPPGAEDRPVANVDWCDAFMYCAWAGKRLCGRIGGGALTQSKLNNAAIDQWYVACSNGDTRVFPYGPTFQPSACNTKSAGVGASVAVATMPGCEGGFPGLYDLSGNVGEWTDTCESYEPDGGDAVYCKTRGGDFSRNEAESRCDVSNGSFRRGTYAALGFRCCRD